VPKKIIDTLTSNILKSVHTLISLILFYKLCSIVTVKHLKPLLLENHIHIVAFIPDLQRVSFYSIIDFLYYSSTIKPILSLMLYKGILSKALSLTLIQKIVISLITAVVGQFV